MTGKMCLSVLLAEWSAWKPQEPERAASAAIAGEPPLHRSALCKAAQNETRRNESLRSSPKASLRASRWPRRSATPTNWTHDDDDGRRSQQVARPLQASLGGADQSCATQPDLRVELTVSHPSEWTANKTPAALLQSRQRRKFTLKWRLRVSVCYSTAPAILLHSNGQAQ